MNQIDTSQVLSDAWTAYKRNIGFYALTMLLFVILPAALIIGGMFLIAPSPDQMEPPRPANMSGVMMFCLFGGLMGIIPQLYNIGLQNCAMASAKGDNVSWKNLLPSGKVFIKIIGAWALLYIAFVIASFFCILPGLILMFFMLFVTNIIIDEPETDIFKAIGESARLTQNNLGHILLMHLLLYAISLVLCFTVVGIFFIPTFAAVVYAVFYLKIKEKDQQNANSATPPPYNFQNSVPPPYNPSAPTPPPFDANNNAINND